MHSPAPFLVTGVDLGQAQDPTGLAVVECTSTLLDARHQAIERSFAVRDLEPKEAVDQFNSFPRPISKKDLVGLLQVILQAGRIKIAPGLEHANTLLGELANLRINPGAAVDPIGDWRVGPQDDLMLAVAIAVWEAERRPYFPPESRRQVRRQP
jgi:hypothetical protein